MRKIFSRSKWVIGFMVMFLILGIMGNSKVSSKEESSDTNALISALMELKERIGELERKVIEHEEGIGRQLKALEKVGEIVPAVEEMLLPIEPKFLVEKFVLNGVHLFTAKDFEFILGKYRHKELGVRDLNKIADEITGFYRSKGYITSLAYVPAQEMTADTVEFSVVEGRVGDIKVEEGKYYSRKTIKRKFLIEKGEILDYEKLQQNVKRINRHPGRTVKAVLMPGKEKGTSDILLELEEEERPLSFTLAEYSNRGTTETGKDRLGVGFVHNNLLGRDDILSAKFRTGKDSDVYAVSADYNFPISRRDTRLGINGAYSQSDIGGQFKVLEPEGRASVYGVYLTHPLFDKDFLYPVNVNLSSSVTLGMDVLDVTNKILGQETSHDKLTVAKAGITFDQRDRLGRTLLSNEVRVGIPNFLGSMGEDDVMSSRLDAGGEFRKYTGSLSRITRLPFSSLLITSVRGQFTDKPLVNSEQISFGGADSIRGYPENDYLADYGWMSTIELRTPAFIFPGVLKVPGGKERISLRDAVQFVYFVDFGEGYLKEARVGEDSDKFFVGAGVGLRFELYNHLSGRIDWGFPVGSEDPNDNSSSTVHIGGQLKL